MAYSPRAVAITTGLIGVLAAPNRWVAALFVVGGGAIDTISTAWSRWFDNRRDSNGDRSTD